MKRRNNEQPTDKKPVVANKKLWREIPEGLQGKVRGGWEDGGSGKILAGSGNDSLNGGCGDD